MTSVPSLAPARGRLLATSAAGVAATGGAAAGAVVAADAATAGRAGAAGRLPSRLADGATTLCLSLSFSRSVSLSRANLRISWRDLGAVARGAFSAEDGGCGGGGCSGCGAADGGLSVVNSTAALVADSSSLSKKSAKSPIGAASWSPSFLHADDATATRRQTRQTTRQHGAATWHLIASSVAYT